MRLFLFFGDERSFGISKWTFFQLFVPLYDSFSLVLSSPSLPSSPFCLSHRAEVVLPSSSLPRSQGWHHHTAASSLGVPIHHPDHHRQHQQHHLRMHTRTHRRVHRPRDDKKRREARPVVQDCKPKGERERTTERRRDEPAGVGRNPWPVHFQQYISINHSTDKSDESDFRLQRENNNIKRQEREDPPHAPTTPPTHTQRPPPHRNFPRGSATLPPS